MSHERYLPMTLPNKLAHLAEEAGEVVAAVGKTLRFGLDSENPELPDGVREKNRVWLKRELEDLKSYLSAVARNNSMNSRARAVAGEAVPNCFNSDLKVAPAGRW